MLGVTERLTAVPERGSAVEHVWDSIARHYAAFGSPLVPCQDDIQSFERAVQEKSVQGRSTWFRAVMLGVTPGVALMRWPSLSTITAVDRSRAVIGALWPGNVSGHRYAVCASWTAIPVEPHSCDAVVGDGSFIACRFPDEVLSLASAVSNLLKDDGILAIRSYVRPKDCESIEQVFNALCSRKLGVDEFKMRLWMAMQRCAEEGVAVRDAARLLLEYGVCARVMQENLGWTRAAVEPFSTWMSSEAIYTFPTLSELRDLFAVHFREVSIHFPGYELGTNCPVLVMRKRL